MSRKKRTSAAHQEAAAAAAAAEPSTAASPASSGRTVASLSTQRRSKKCSSCGFCGWVVRRIFLLYIVFVSLYTCPTSPDHLVCKTEGAVRSAVIDPVHRYILSTEAGARVNSAYQAHLVPFYHKHGTPIVGYAHTFVVENVVPLASKAAKPVCDAVAHATDPYKEKVYAAYSTYAKSHVDNVRTRVCAIANDYVMPAATSARDGTVRVVNEYVVPFSKSALNDHLIPLYHDHIQPRWNNHIKPGLCRYSKIAVAYTRAHILPAIADGAARGYEIACDFTATHVVPRAKHGAVHVYVFFKTHVCPPVRKLYDENLKEHVDRVVPWDRVEVVTDKLYTVGAKTAEIAMSFTEEFYYMCYTIVTGDEHPSVIARMKAEEALEHRDGIFAGTKGDKGDDSQIPNIARRFSGSARQWIQIARGWVGSAAANAKSGVKAYGRATDIYHRATKVVADQFAKTAASPSAAQSTSQAQDSASKAATETPAPTPTSAPAQEATEAAAIVSELPVPAEDAASAILEARESIASVLVEDEAKAAFEDLVKGAAEPTARLETFPSVLNDADEASAPALPLQPDTIVRSTAAEETTAEQEDDTAAHVATTIPPPQEPQAAEEETTAPAIQQTSEVQAQPTPTSEKMNAEVKRDTTAVPPASSVSTVEKQTKTAEVGSLAPVAIATPQAIAAVPATVEAATTASESAKETVEVSQLQSEATPKPKVVVTKQVTEIVKVHKTQTFQVTTTVDVKTTITTRPAAASTAEAKSSTTTETTAAPKTKESEASSVTATTQASTQEIYKAAEDKVADTATKPSAEQAETKVDETAEQPAEPTTVPLAAEKKTASASEPHVAESLAEAIAETEDAIVATTTTSAPTTAVDTTAVDTIDDEVRKAASNWVKDARKSISREIAEERTRSSTLAAEAGTSVDVETKEVRATPIAAHQPSSVSSVEQAVSNSADAPASEAVVEQAREAADASGASDGGQKAAKSSPSRTIPKPKADKTEALSPRANAPADAEPAPVDKQTAAKRVKKPLLNDDPAGKNAAKGPRKIKRTKKRVIKKNQL